MYNALYASTSHQRSAFATPAPTNAGVRRETTSTPGPLPRLARDTATTADTMTRPNIVRADTIDLQDQDNPSAAEHSKPAVQNGLAPH